MTLVFSMFLHTTPLQHTSMHLKKLEEESTADANLISYASQWKSWDAPGWFSCPFSFVLCTAGWFWLVWCMVYKLCMVSSCMGWPADSHTWLQGGRSNHRILFCHDCDLRKSLNKFHEILVQISGYLAGLGQNCW